MLWLSWYGFLKTSDVSKAVSWREFDKSLLKKKTLLRVKEITNDWSTRSPLLLLDDFDHCWPDAWSQRWDRLLSLFLLLDGIGHFWAGVGLLTSQLWGWLFRDGAEFSQVGLTSHMLSFQRLTSGGMEYSEVDLSSQVDLWGDSSSEMGLPMVSCWRPFWSSCTST